MMRSSDLSKFTRAMSVNHRCFFEAMKRLQRPTIWWRVKIGHEKANLTSKCRRYIRGVLLLFGQRRCPFRCCRSSSHHHRRRRRRRRGRGIALALAPARSLKWPMVKQCVGGGRISDMHGVSHLGSRVWDTSNWTSQCARTRNELQFTVISHEGKYQDRVLRTGFPDIPLKPIYTATWPTVR